MSRAVILLFLVAWVANPLPTAAPTFDRSAWEFNITLTATDDTYVNRWPCSVSYVFGSSASLKVKTRPFTDDIVYAAFLRFALDDVAALAALAALAATGAWTWDFFQKYIYLVLPYL